MAATGARRAADKKADLAGPGIGSYEELEKVLPQDYASLLSPRDTQRAIYAAKATSRRTCARS